MSVETGNWFSNQKEVELRLAGVEGTLSNSNFRIKADGTAQLYNTDSGEYHSIWLTGSGANVVLNIAQTGEA